MKTKILILLAFLIILNTCKDGITNPPEPEPGRRDYVWKVDTLDMPMNLISSVWGSSPNDVWVVGAGGDSENRLLHFDGTSWETYNKEYINCTGRTLWGFSNKNIWMGGNTDGRIWHYDGNQWSENFRYVVEGAYNVGIADIWGLYWNDIYACGIISYNAGGSDSWRGFVLHYDGTSWKEIVQANYNSQFLKIRKEQNELYVFSYSLDKNISSNDTITFLKIRENEFQKIYSNSSENIYWGNLTVINKAVYFLIDQDVYKYKDGNFVKQFSFKHPNFGYQFYGRHEKDIFLRMRDGLAHYNGFDIQYMFNFPLNMISIIHEPMIFEKEIFFCLWEASYGRNMILHGKLKE